jgi:hypothetical protein
LPSDTTAHPATIEASDHPRRFLLERLRDVLFRFRARRAEEPARIQQEQVDLGRVCRQLGAERDEPPDQRFRIDQIFRTTKGRDRKQDVGKGRRPVGRRG